MFSKCYQLSRFSETEMKPEFTVEVLQKDKDVTVNEGSPAKLQWKITGTKRR
jgi:hypothetical protein